MSDRLGHLPPEIRAHWDNPETIRAFTALEDIYFDITSADDSQSVREKIYHACIKACHGTPWEVGA